jgi:predicted RecA/RadA family phage recombinase
MKNFVQPGNVMTVTVPDGTDDEAVSAGDGLLIGSMFGVVAYDAEPGGTTELHVVGVYDMAKTSAQAWTLGAAVYWDDSAKVVTTTSGGNTLIGVAAAVADNPSATGWVRLNGSF